ncbi:MAG: SDR family NAD(P)-dependent oxidoreductase [Muribaculaceae bacterium]|jgi:short-subunit dehydrogenase|nr:SDR family NAD(P)-dependent oxidoreductase [Muribaculaceae bacterium]
MKKIIIVGASSGIGKQVALNFIADGWKVGVAARREEALKELKLQIPAQVEYEVIDITSADATSRLNALIDKLGGMDIYFHCSGVGHQNTKIDIKVEVDTVRTNALGFTQMSVAAYNYFKDNKKQGQIAVVSSIAGTKGLGVSPSYSATKRYNYIYLDCLEQLSRMQNVNITFTDIRPGFVTTALLDDGQKYPMQMSVEYAAKKIFKAVKRRKRVAVIDWKYSILVLFWKLIPRWLWVRLPIHT